MHSKISHIFVHQNTDRLALWIALHTIIVILFIFDTISGRLYYIFMCIYLCITIYRG